MPSRGDTRQSKDTGHAPAEGSSEQVYGVREMIQAREKASTRPIRRRQETVVNPEKCQFEYKHLSSHFQSLKEYIDSEDKDIYNGDIPLFKDQIGDSVEILYQSDQSNPQMESLKAIQRLKNAAYEFRESVDVAKNLAGIFDSLEQTWIATQPDVPSSSRKGKEKAQATDSSEQAGSSQDVNNKKIAFLFLNKIQGDFLSCLLRYASNRSNDIEKRKEVVALCHKINLAVGYHNNTAHEGRLMGQYDHDLGAPEEKAIRLRVLVNGLKKQAGSNLDQASKQLNKWAAEVGLQ